MGNSYDLLKSHIPPGVALISFIAPLTGNSRDGSITNIKIGYKNNINTLAETEGSDALTLLQDTNYLSTITTGITISKVIVIGFGTSISGGRIQEWDLSTYLGPALNALQNQTLITGGANLLITKGALEDAFSVALSGTYSPTASYTLTSSNIALSNLGDAAAFANAISLADTTLKEGGSAVFPTINGNNWNTSVTDDAFAFVVLSSMIQDFADALYNSINSLNSGLSTLNSALTSADGSITTLQSDVTAANSNISTLQGQATTAASNITTLQSDVTAANSNISSLQGQVTTAGSNITTLQSDVTAANSNISTLQGQVTTAASNITTLQSDVTAANSNISTLQGQVTTAASNITTLQSDVTAANSNITTIQSDLSIVTSNLTSNTGNVTLLRSYLGIR